MKKVAIIQSNYMPWRGYFDIIQQVDEFIFHDDVQYTKQDWRNRNKIKTHDKEMWLTVPCGSCIKILINEVKITGFEWNHRHWGTIKEYYKKAEFFAELNHFFQGLYFSKNWKFLSDFNQHSIEQISRLLGIDTEFTNSTDYDPVGVKQDKVIDLCVKANANIYLSGPAGKNYINEKEFGKKGIQVEWMKYDYASYPQLYGEFKDGLSIIDTLMNTKQLSL